MAKKGLLKLAQIRGHSFLQMMYLNRDHKQPSIIFSESVEAAIRGKSELFFNDFMSFSKLIFPMNYNVHDLIENHQHLFISLILKKLFSGLN
jgi:hypothetical protein